MSARTTTGNTSITRSASPSLEGAQASVCDLRTVMPSQARKCRLNGMAGCITHSTSLRPQTPLPTSGVGNCPHRPNLTGTIDAYRPKRLAWPRAVNGQKSSPAIMKVLETLMRESTVRNAGWPGRHCRGGLRSSWFSLNATVRLPRDRRYLCPAWASSAALQAAWVRERTSCPYRGRKGRRGHIASNVDPKTMKANREARTSASDISLPEIDSTAADPVRQPSGRNASQLHLCELATASNPDENLPKDGRRVCSDYTRGTVGNIMSGAARGSFRATPAAEAIKGAQPNRLKRRPYETSGQTCHCRRIRRRPDGWRFDDRRAWSRRSLSNSHNSRCRSSRKLPPLAACRLRPARSVRALDKITGNGDRHHG